MRVFIVEKDKQFRELIGRSLLENTYYEVLGFDNTNSMMIRISDKPDLIIINASFFEDNDSLAINQMQINSPGSSILVVCQPSEISKCSSLLDLGIYDYIITGRGFTKKLINIARNISKLTLLETELSRIKSQLGDNYELASTILGESKAIKKIIKQVEKAISLQNVLVSLEGERGTGKELIAKTIHFNSVRKDSPFITLNLEAVPPEMVEYELFGYEKGSHPGAFSRAVGKLEQAHLGSLFINEISELNPEIQEKLVKFLKQKTLKREGSQREISLNTRIIAASSKTLHSELEKGNLIEDLYYILLGLPISLPPLAERGNDIVILAKHFLENFCRKNNIDRMQFSTKAMAKLLGHNYPGNISELNSIVDFAAVLSPNNFIEEEHILFSPGKSTSDLLNLDLPLREFEIRIIKHFLEKYNNNVVLVARKLEIGKSKIYNMIKNGEL